MKNFRKRLQEKWILTFVMSILLLVVLFSATTAWYAINDNARVYNMKLKLGGTGGIKVAVEPGGPDISELPNKNDEEIPIISFPLADLNNISKEEGKQMIAPGAYGPMNFYITALGEKVKGYSLKVQLEYKEMEGVQSPDLINKIEGLMREHISVYKTMTMEGDYPVFSEPLKYYSDFSESDGTPLTGDLIFDNEVEATVYWVWNYEYSDIPGNETATREQIRQYDEEDTILGNCVQNIWFNIYIEGITEGDDVSQ